MTEFLPPMFGTAPPLTCTRIGCDADATWHVLWTADLENGLCCDEHYAETRRRWVYYAAHPYEPICSGENVLLAWREDGTSCCTRPDDPHLRFVEERIDTEVTP